MPILTGSDSKPDIAVAPDPQRPALPQLSDPANDPIMAAPVRPQPPFIYFHHPNRWMVVGGKVVPLLKKVKLVDGLHGITLLRSGKWDVSDMKTNQAKSGFREIPWEADGASYIREAQPGVWVSRFERVEFNGNTTPDTDAYVEWLESLVESGLIPEVSNGVLDAMISTNRTRIQHLSGKPGTEHFSRAYQADVEACLAIRDARRAKPKPKRKPKAKASPEVSDG